MLISKPELYGKKNAIKYIIEYSDDVIRPIRIFLPQMTVVLNILMIIRQCLFLLMTKNC